MRKGMVAGLAVAAGLLIAGTANAAPITYTYSGEGSGTVNGAPFANQAYSFVLQGDTTATTSGGTINPITSGTVTIAGTACSGGCALTSPALYEMRSDFDSSGSGVIGIGVVGGGDTGLNEAFFGATAPGLDLALPTAPVIATATNGFAPYVSFATSGGPVQITPNTVGPFPTFSSALTAVVPTLSEWAMILMGLLLAGAGAVWTGRRRLA
ncbi:MAG: IPTL-CTERM sorting domain-containing protein [Brevundimonas sp.]|uniref:IPTL-CTERM sorting domain-containing protein n=1 Tax=Brevundimonas sp. TaxID=1871086 RepID=UPI0025BD50A0|nr:IPTL-CTERM sorting domain-containing protein [Brevundimonas sp.]MBX3476907.1 IPTL-CTERM sorting domain-containing protein [Brevundimonas sp.]